MKNILLNIIYFTSLPAKTNYRQVHKYQILKNLEIWFILNIIFYKRTGTSIVSIKKDDVSKVKSFSK